jgi:hypothetical protein
MNDALSYTVDGLRRFWRDEQCRASLHWQPAIAHCLAGGGTVVLPLLHNTKTATPTPTTCRQREETSRPPPHISEESNRLDEVEEGPNNNLFGLDPS